MPTKKGHIWKSNVNNIWHVVSSGIHLQQRCQKAAPYQPCQKAAYQSCQKAAYQSCQKAAYQSCQKAAYQSYLPILPKGSLPTLPEGNLPTLQKSSLPTLPKGSLHILPKSSLPTLQKSSLPNLPKGSLPTPPEGSLQTLPKSSLQTLPKGSLPPLPTGITPALGKTKPNLKCNLLQRPHQHHPSPPTTRIRKMIGPQPLTHPSNNKSHGHSWTSHQPTRKLKTKKPNKAVITPEQNQSGEDPEHEKTKKSQ